MRHDPKRALALCGLTALFLSMAAAPPKPASPTKPAAPKFAATTVRAILAQPKKWDGKQIQVEGTIAEYTEKTSARGHDYTTFRLTTPEVKEPVAVFSFTHLGLADGKRARIRGLFQETRKVGENVYHNEIDASKPAGRVETLK